MTEVQRDPFGRSFGYRKMSPADAADQVIATALAVVRRDGLQVNLEADSFEAIINQSGVPRSRVYRRWPTKSFFYADLLRALSVDNQQGVVEALLEVVRDSCQQVQHQRALLATPQGRRRVLSEIVRTAVQHYIELFVATSRWSTELALASLIDSLPDGAVLKSDLREGIAEVRRDTTQLMARYIRALCRALGYRLQGIEGDNAYEIAAELIIGANSGSALRLMVFPQQGPSLAADPFGTGMTQPWSMTTLHYAAVINGLFVEDDAADAVADGSWSEEQVAARVDELTGFLTVIEGQLSATAPLQ